MAMKPQAKQLHQHRWNVSFPGALFLLFLALKLGVGNTGVQDWSWWWVAAPMWIPLAFAALLLFVGGVLTGIAAILER